MGFDIDSYLPDQARKDILLLYKGNVDSDVINHVLDTIEYKMTELNEQSKLRKKVYNVLVESLQNLYHHVDKPPVGFDDATSDKFGLLIILKAENGYRIITGNFVQTGNIEKLEEKLQRINKSSREEIKELYKYILNHQRISAKGGGGLGLVDIARKTGHKLDYEFKKYDNNFSFFYLNILVNEESETIK